VLKTRTWLTVAVLLSAVVLIYSNHFHNAFHFDDFHSITNNVAIRSLSHIPRFFVDARASSVFPSHQAWRPLVTASLAIDYWLGHGYDPFYFHLSGFLWFLVLILCAASLFRSILDRAQPNADHFFVAWFAAAWYGLHPAMAETVNYIIQRADVISTCGIVAGLAIYARFPAWRQRGVYLLPVTLGLLAKPPALIFPAILAAYLFLIEEGATRDRWPRVLRRSVPALVLSLVFLVLQSALTPKSFNAGAGSAFHYLITQPYVWFRYFTSFFLPLHLSADTDLEPLPSLFTLEAAGGFLFAGFLLLSIYLTAKRPAGRPAAFGLCWFVLGLVPTSIFPLAEVENDHRMFLPFVGLTLAVSWSGYQVARRLLWGREARVAMGAAAICLLVVCAAGTHRRNQVWHTEESLWEDVTLKSPKNGRGLMNYGLARMSQGDFRGALIYFERALAYTPNYADLEINLGIDYGALGQDAEAEQHFHRAIDLAPADAQVRFFYGRWLKEKRRDDQAVAELHKAILLSPDYLEARLLLLDSYAGQGAWSSLASLATETLKLAPDDPTARRYAEMKPAQAKPAAPPPLPTPESLLNLSLAAYQKNDFESCIRFAELALKQRPGYPEAYNNLIAAYNSLGRWDDAIAAGRQALRIKPDYQLARNNLLWAEAQKNRQAPRRR
jgi:protein O-mannosyl-transferase